MDGRTRPAEEFHAAALSDLSEEFAVLVSTGDVLRALDTREPLVGDELTLVSRLTRALRAATRGGA